MRTRLARHVLLPLALVWLVGTGITVAVAHYYARQAFDRALLDDAYALAANVRENNGALSLMLTQSELGALLFDQTETVSFAVVRRDGSLISGHPWLLAVQAAPLAADGRGFEFGDVDHLGKSLRLVRLDRSTGAGYAVLVAQTTRSRDTLLQRVLVFAFAPQLALLLLLAVWLRRAIDADLRPLQQFQEALDKRNANDLSAVGVATTTRDVQRLGAAVNALMARIGAGVRAQREFAGNVAHELRTLLAGIRAMTEYGLAHQEPEIWRQQLTSIAASETRASHMVEQLLALAFADESRDTLRLRPVALDELVRRVVLEAMPRADALSIDLGVAGIDEATQVPGDVALIEGALTNLIDNALRYGRPGGGRAAVVTVAVSKKPGGVALQVMDNGPGIEPRARQTLLRRWQQAASTSAQSRLAHQGVGLGLAIVSRYAELLGARFELADADAAAPQGPGLCASLVWPIGQNDRPPADSLSQTDPHSGHHTGLTDPSTK